MTVGGFESVPGSGRQDWIEREIREIRLEALLEMIPMPEVVGRVQCMQHSVVADSMSVAETETEAVAVAVARAAAVNMAAAASAEVAAVAGKLETEVVEDSGDLEAVDTADDDCHKDPLDTSDRVWNWIVLIGHDLLVSDFPQREDRMCFEHNLILMAVVVMEDQVWDDLAASLAVEVVLDSIVLRSLEGFEDYSVGSWMDSGPQGAADIALDLRD